MNSQEFDSSQHSERHLVAGLRPEVNDYPQQYLYKNPNGYCGIGGTGVTCPIGLGVRQS